MRIVAIAVAGLAVSACASPEKPFEAKIVGSDFCKIVDKKLTWSTADTKPTIHGIRRLNAKWDERCRTKQEATS